MTSKFSRLRRGFYRQGPDYRFDDQVDFIDIRDTFGFRTMVVGKWVTKEERFISANLIYDALADLAQILQLPPKAIGLRGKLNFAFGHGGQQGVQAHYNSATHTLALAKNAGGGALAHEWFHAFDHHICRFLFPSALSNHFASARWLQAQAAIEHPLNQALHKFYKAVFLTTEGDEGNDYVKQAIAFDTRQQQHYMSMPEELAARCFEACIARHKDIQNSFLVGGLMQSGLIYPAESILVNADKALSDYFSHLGYLLHQA